MRLYGTFTRHEPEGYYVEGVVAHVRNRAGVLRITSVQLVCAWFAHEDDGTVALVDGPTTEEIDFWTFACVPVPGWKHYASHYLTVRGITHEVGRRGRKRHEALLAGSPASAIIRIP